MLRLVFWLTGTVVILLSHPSSLLAAALQERSAEMMRAASTEGNLEEVKACIEANVDVNAAGRYGVTALALACDHGHADVVEVLLNAGANPNVKDSFYGFAPISWALMRKNPRIIQMLVDKGVDDVDSGLTTAVGSRNEQLVTPFLKSKRVTGQGLADAYRAAKRTSDETLIKVIEAFLNDEARAIIEKAETDSKKTPTPDSATSPSIEKEALSPRITLSPDFPLNDTNWPQFRGLLSRGISEEATLPTAWSAEENRGIAWKVPIPGLATSSPICWDDRIVVTTADQEGDRAGFRTGAYGDVDSVKGDGICSYQVICLERSSGKILWQKECAREAPKVKRHLKASHANPTPATDGEVVIASFAGAGIYGLDLVTGEILWNKDLGKLDSGWFYDKSYQWGFGSSPRAIAR